MASHEIIKPVDVDISGSSIVINWDDGHRGIYPHRMLRLRCSFASCGEEMTGRALLDPDTVPRHVRALAQMTAGQWTLRFTCGACH